MRLSTWEIGVIQGFELKNLGVGLRFWFGFRPLSLEFFNLRAEFIGFGVGDTFQGGYRFYRERERYV